MKRNQAALPLALGFLAIGVGLFAWAMALFVYMQSEAEIGQRLVDEGIETDALLVTAEYRERLSCRGGTIKACRRSDYALGQVVFLVGELRAVIPMTLTEAEFTGFEDGDEVRIPIIYLEDAPREIERERGDRLAAAQGEALNIYVLLAFGLTFALIGGAAALVARNRASRPSTGPDG